MANIEMTKEKAEKFNRLEAKAIDICAGVLDGGTVDENAKFAMQSLKVVSQNRQTANAHEACKFGMALTIGSESELRKYVKATQPEIKKLLTGK